MAEGVEIDDVALACLSPYQTEHINRFGRYTLKRDRVPEPLDRVRVLRMPLRSEGLPAEKIKNKCDVLANILTATQMLPQLCPEPPRPKRVSPSPPTSTAANTHVVSNPPGNKSHPYDCSAMRPCRSGTTPSSLNCEVVFACGLT